MGKLSVLLLVVIGAVLLGCATGPTDEEIAESVAQTETAEAMPTHTPAPSRTSIPTRTKLPIPTPVPTNTPIPTNTPTPSPPTVTSTPTDEPLPEAEFEVVFDGKDCTVDGPTELPAGEHTFDFIDTSYFRGEVYLIYLQEGKTFQDNLDLQNEPGHWYPKPAWAYYDSRLDSSKRPESNGRRVTLTTWNLDRVGEHTIICYVGGSSQKLWFAAPLMITETPSE